MGVAIRGGGDNGRRGVGRGTGSSGSSNTNPRGPAPRAGRATPAARAEALERRVLLAGDAVGGTPQGGGVDPEPIFPDSYEPNNSLSAARDLGVLGAVSLADLTIHQGGNKDFYKFTAAATAQMTASFGTIQSSGPLTLTVYDQTQQAVASSSTTNGGGVVFPAVGGQTYYIGVAGNTTAVTAEYYELRIGTPVASFDWSMAPRLGGQGQVDDLGYPVVHNTQEYVRPNPVVVHGVEHATFPVVLNASDTSLGVPVTNYEWLITNGPIAARTLNSANPVTTTDLAEGQYSVRLRASGTLAGSPFTRETTQQIKVVNHLVVAIGDSYSSGEGNPARDAQYDVFGFPTAGARWLSGGNDFETQQHRDAHRSPHAGVMRAALMLEQSDPHSSVTFVFLSETGATIEREVLGRTPRADGKQTQIQRLREIAGTRRVDVLTMSAGGNDAGFAAIAGELVEAESTDFGYEQRLSDLWARYRANELRLRTVLYPALAAELHSTSDSLDVGQVLLTEYIDPSYDANGETALQILDDIAGGFEVDRRELNLVRTNVINPLGLTVAAAAQRHGWTYVGDVSAAFHTHGYGNFADSWIRTASESIRMQGPVGNVNFPSLDEMRRTTGTAHPDASGHAVYRDRILGKWRQADLYVTGFTLSPEPPTAPFLPGSGQTFGVTVRNQGLMPAVPSALRLYVSDDETVQTDDALLHEVQVPALAPGESVTLTGVLPAMTDPFRTDNEYWVGPVADAAGAVGESNESNNGPNYATAARYLVRSDLNLLSVNRIAGDGPFLGRGTPVAASLGAGEFIGAYDMDFFLFSAAAGERLAFDIDAAAGGPDTFVRLYPRDFITLINPDAPLASNDNGRAPGEPAGASGESYLTHTFAETGEYALVVSSAANAAANPLLLAGRVAGPTGAYTVTLTEAPPPPAQVVARHVFDNNSAYDNPAAGRSDDDAIAPGKTALLPGGTATAAHYTGYSKGINGIMVDIADLPANVRPAADDFVLRVGNTATPSAWTLLPPAAAPSVTVRRDAGANGSDRVTLVWPDHLIKKTWLQVTVLPGPRTGLTAADVFYFGNAPGETFNSTTQFKVDSQDVTRTRNAQARPTTITSLYDHNRDGRVNATDLTIARINQGSTLANITVPGAGAGLTAGGRQPVAAVAPPTGTGTGAPKRSRLSPDLLVDDGDAG